MSQRILGVDLGAHSVKLVVASAGFRTTQIVDTFEQEIPAGDGPPDERAWVALAALLDRHGLRNDTALIGLPGDAVSVRVLDFPFAGLKRADLEKAVGGELEGQLPHDLEELVFDCEQIPMVDAPRPMAGDDDPTAVSSVPGAPHAGTRVLAAASSLERATAWVNAARKIGVEPRSLVAAPLAYARAVDALLATEGPEARAEAIAVVDVGHVRTNVAVVHGGKVVFARTLSRGGRGVTQAIAKAWNLPWDDAERIKRTQAEVQAGATAVVDPLARPTQTGVTDLHDVVMREVQPLARDLRQTLAACRAQAGVLAARILLVGGGARLAGLRAYLAGELEVPVDGIALDQAPRLIGAPATARGQGADVALLALGLALEGASGRPRFDLRKGALAFRADLSFLRAKASLLAACGLVIVAFAAVNAYASLYALRKEEAILDERLATATTEVFGEALDAATVMERVAPQKEKSPLPKLTAFDQLVEISKKVPAKDKVKLDVLELEIKKDKVMMRAKTDSAKAIDGIEAELKTISCYSDAQRGKVTGPEGEKEFSLTFTSKCM